jgi:hypothetical protein
MEQGRKALSFFLCGSLGVLCVSVVNVFCNRFTTETQRTTEIAQSVSGTS